MRKITLATLAIAAAATFAAAAAATPTRSSDTTIVGAGSTFVAPLIANWVQPVGAAYGIELQYSAIGSGGGVSAVTARTVDLGMTDAPLSPDQFSACNGCVQIPWALGATAVMYNAPVPNLLHMDGPTLGKIFLGQITNWNDPAIKKLNPKADLPDLKISIAHRSDNSGTTFNFTDYLSSVSPAWKSQVGPAAVAVNWPTGTGARGSSGVAGLVTQTSGTIGYADVYYAIHNHLKYFAMKNRSGKFTTPGLRGMVAAASSDQKPAADNSLSIVNPPKKYANAYPICTFTYVVSPLQTSKASAVKHLLFWAVTKGQAYGPKLFFSPIPKSVLVVDEKAIAKIHS